ncbi:MAG: putative toluenesulfonate zinc-independent alcohol dehydrogenase oxidoreductase protein [Pseudomonadota bacterium]|jgi:3-oxoacyl-[acyl-carrier protein] reductase
MRLDNKVSIITGGASGFGEGIAKRFAQEGARIVIADINDTLGAQVAHSVGGLYVHCDVSKDEEVKSLIEATTKHFGALDVVVNNAGTTHMNKPILEVSEDEFDRVYAVNIKSLFLMTRHVVPVFRAQGRGGAMVNIASTAGVRPRPGLVWYNSTKGAMITASKGMAAELAKDKIRVNCINPVAGDTPLLPMFMGGDTPEHRARFLSVIPMGRFSQPADIANATLFLASDEAEFITGACLEVDGGRCV